MKHLFEIYISRILVQNIPFMKSVTLLNGIFSVSIISISTDEMGKKSEIVKLAFSIYVPVLYNILGILLKNETKHQDMISIMDTLQQYVPCVRHKEDEILSTGETVNM